MIKVSSKARKRYFSIISWKLCKIINETKKL